MEYEVYTGGGLSIVPKPLKSPPLFTTITRIIMTKGCGFPKSGCGEAKRAPLMEGSRSATAPVSTHIPTLLHVHNAGHVYV